MRPRCASPTARARTQERARKAEEAADGLKTLRSELSYLKSELDDERTKREKVEAQLKQALGG